ncbi:PIR protein [Plasmodium yoelii]|uniref:PIR protein n=2 Tax=Plasmodium yoelii TaxID=5861 RepID=A0AAF0B3X1_PLAYO|nr:PIR protein [Plasmodium yoelii]WBY56504.1 PIR protein [Plasmodium yoelii yoelii]CDU16596.1 YIR protein [Plasmodium yoelii]VTZ77010.1 PIR protein [Plasmodium yoelii]|eukprot:XP_022811871.2 PIR protein [Plasmodium yoelii]
MNKQVCKTLQEVKEWFFDELGSNGDYQLINVEHLKKHCISKCDNNFDKINAVCLYLLDQFYKHEGLLPSPSRSNPNIVDNIFIWLSYMLSLDTTIKYNGIKYFYENYITQRSTYKEYINDLTYYDTYKELIDTRKNFLDMDSNTVFKFYEALISLCKLYNELGDENKNCKNYLDDNNEFFKKYKDLNEDTNITKNSYYNEILSTLLNDYNDFKRECTDILSSSSEETKQNPGQIPVDSSGLDLGLVSGLNLGQESEEDSEVASSSSSITNKLIPVLLILGAIPIFLGIAYKYSLFGFRKRVQKNLREKLKK